MNWEGLPGPDPTNHMRGILRHLGGFQGDGKLMNDFEEGMRFNAVFKN